MPNWVINKIVVGDKAAIRKCIKRNEYGVVEYDFNEIVPMPEEIYKGSLGEEERKKYGRNNWYDWSILNWGTKWNAHDYYRVNGDTFCISTAWSTPEPVMKALSKKFKCSVTVYYADEDIGNNCGCYTYDNGILIEDWTPDNPEKFANELWGNEETEW